MEDSWRNFYVKFTDFRNRYSWHTLVLRGQTLFFLRTARPVRFFFCMRSAGKKRVWPCETRHKQVRAQVYSNVLKLHTAQKVYSVNKGLFLGVLSSPWFVVLQLLTWHAPLVIDFLHIYLMECCGCKLIVLWYQNV